MTASPREVTEYATLTEFYIARPDCLRSPEADYGVHWREAGRRGHTWRVSYVQATGEIYAVQLGNGPVKILGVVEPDPDTRTPGFSGGLTYYRTLDRILDGWADPDVSGFDLAWITRRLQDTGAAS
jgi:hypothetical protein